MLFPSIISNDPCTRVLLTDARQGDDLPDVLAVMSASEPEDFSEAVEQSPRATPLLTEHSRNVFIHPGITGQRVDSSSTSARFGRDWSPRFVLSEDPIASDNRLLLSSQDVDAGLRLTTEIQSLRGGSLRIRHVLKNIGYGTYLLEGLELRIPLPDDFSEILDFSGRHEHERDPQRHPIADGAWVRESRKGRPDFSGSLVFVGTKGFDFHHGDVMCVQPAWSGNSVVAVERDAADVAGVAVGELLLPGEICLEPDEEYTMPWVMVTASSAGLDPIANSLHTWERGLSSHPDTQPVTLNVWEAVMFNHDLGALQDIADRAASVGVERYVLDDGWFHSRRDDHAGLGDWWVDSEVWPEGLHPLIDYVHQHGMQFGLWFEPEMVNPDSDLYREHPDWAMRASSRTPEFHRNQLVLDLTNPEAFDHVFRAMSAVLDEYGIDYVKWDHNRELLEGGSPSKGCAPCIHEQTLAYYRLLDQLKSRHPNVVWESCASGGGRIDLGVIEKVGRFWNSDMTDALSRQKIQRWTVQTVAPEYLGAHISQPTSQQSGRSFSLDFRAATAVFFSFGIEWDIRGASDADLKQMQRWIAWYKKHRAFLHTGVFERLDVADDAVLAHGVVAQDGSEAIIAHVQYEESSHNRGVYLRVPGLAKHGRFALAWTGPAPVQASRESLDSRGPVGDALMSGEYLERVGIRIPRCAPETMRMIHIVQQ
jgi:alpha-galactosidase